MILANDTGLLFSPYNWDVTADRAFSICAGAWVRTLLNDVPTSISLKFDISTMTTTNPTKIAYRINRQAWVIETVTASVSLAMPATPPNQKKTLLEVLFLTSSEGVNRWTNSGSAVKLTGIDVQPTTITLSKPDRRSLLGLIFGDSITEGVSTMGSQGDSTTRSQSLLSWAYQTTDALGADLAVVGFGGHGMSLPVSGIPKLPDSWSYNGNGMARDFTPQPDFVAINLGTNDKNQNVAVDTFKTDYINTVNAMLSRLTKAVIFPMMPFGGHYGIDVYKSIAASTNDPSRVSVIDTTGWWSPGDSLDGVHPLGYTAPRLSTLTAQAISTRLAQSSGRSGAELVWTGSEWA